jgi:EmrB/QacA subfamily drug resistance transporter
MGRRRPALILAICCMSLFIVNMDATIVNVALPSIGADLHAPISGLQWTIDAYVVVLACFLLLAGSTADRIGRRRTFQVGLVLFVMGSVSCSLAPTLEWLVAARVVQALGGSMLNPVAMSIITTVYSAPAAKAKAIGVWGAVAGLGMGLGPLVGGALIDLVGWRAIFWVNLPIGLATLLATALFIPESRSDHPRRFDPVGQVAMLALLGSATFAIIEAPRQGWLSMPTLGCLTLTAVAALILVLYEPRRVHPLIELRFFASAPFCGAVLVAICAFGAYSGVLFLNTLYLQSVRGLTPLQAGFCTLPLALMMATFSPVSGRLVARYGPRPSLVCAGILVCAAGFGLWWVDADTPLVWVLACLAVFGVGHGAVNAPITYTTVSGMPRSHAGVAAAVATTSRQIGTAFGVAIVGSVLSSRIAGPLATEFVSASRPAVIVIAGLGLAVLVIGLVTTGRWGQGTTRRVAHLFGDELPEKTERLSIGS